MLTVECTYVDRFESPTRSLDVKAAQSISVESRAGDITATCVTTLKLQSVAGAVSTNYDDHILHCPH